MTANCSTQPQPIRLTAREVLALPIPTGAELARLVEAVNAANAAREKEYRELTEHLDNSQGEE